MAKACIAIGIERTAGAGLGLLPGAVEGARAFAAWAKAAGFDVELVIDQDDAGKPLPVDVARVAKSLMRLLPAANDGVDRGGPADAPDRLIVYFAGHGMQSAADGEMWLLSDSYNDQLAIGIPQLRSMLETYLPRQIAIISDACRSPMIAAWNVRMAPLPVIPRGPYDPSKFDQIDYDQFLAVPELSSAYMIRGKANEPARCIFTWSLLEALHGAAEAYDRATPDSITSDSIAIYLKAKVKENARRYGVEMLPRVSPGWLDPDTYVTRSELAAMALPPLGPWPAADGVGSQGAAGDSAAIFGSIGQAAGVTRGEAAAPGGGGMKNGGPRRITISGPVEFETPGPPLGTLSDAESTQLVAERDAIRERMRELAARAAMLDAALSRTDRATHHETSCGLTLAGPPVTRTRSAPWLQVTPDASFAGSWRVQFAGEQTSDREGWLLVDLADGRSVATTAIFDYTTDCIFDPSGCAVSSFRRMWLGPSVRLESEDVMALGKLPNLGADVALDWIVQLTRRDNFDILLGVLAAYLLHSAGQIDNVRRLAAIFQTRKIPLPFDIALLARVPVTAGPDGRLIADVPAIDTCKLRATRTGERKALFGSVDPVTIPVAGRYPLLRQGWFLLDPAPPGLVAAGLAELAALLEPAAPFATFTSAGADALAQAMGAA